VVHGQTYQQVKAMFDRREIADLLLPHFPTMEAATSNEWHGFLNAETGMAVALDEPNGSAFDKWRKALAANGLPVWGLSDDQEQAIAARGAELKALEDQRRAAFPNLLAGLAIEAPNVTVADLLK
jgi:hypothetical protein